MSHISGSTAALGCAPGSCPLPGQGAFCCVPCAVLLCGPGVSTANSCQPACGCVAPWCPVACNQACSCSPNCCVPVCCQPAVCEIPSCTGLLCMPVIPCCILPCC